MKTIAVTNQKGGVSKTSTALAMADILMRRGYRVLFVDADSQCNSTDTYGAKTDGVATLYDLIVDEPPCPLQEAIQHTAYGDIIACDPMLEEADFILLGKDDAFVRLKNAMEGLTGYDFVIMDTNPAVNTMLYNALAASDIAVIPVAADRYSATGIGRLTRTVGKIRDSLNPELKVSGILLTRFNERSNLNKDTKEDLIEFAERIGTKLYSANIRNCIKCSEAQAKRLPLSKYAPACTTYLDYVQFMDEFLEEV